MKLNTTVISDVLNKLVDPKNYDKRLRPKYGREPVDVGITIHVSSISAVSEVDMVSSATGPCICVFFGVTCVDARAPRPRRLTKETNSGSKKRAGGPSIF